MQNIMLLYGAEDYLITQKIGECTQNVDNAEFNISTFQNLDNEIKIIESCCQLPFLSDKRVVVVYGDLFSGERKAIEDYINKPNDTTILIFAVTGVDKRKKLYKSLEKVGTIIEYKKLKHGELLDFVKMYLLDKGQSISQDTLDAIVENTAYIAIEEVTLHDVVSELDRLADFVGPTGTISVDSVNTIIKPPAETNVFKLFPLIAAKKNTEAIAYMTGLLRSGTNAMFILSQLLRPFRIMYKLKTVGNASEIGLNSFMVKDFVRDLDNMDSDSIARKINLVIDTQRLIQNGVMNDELALQVLISKLLL